MKSYIGKEINGEIWIRASDVIDDKPQIRLSLDVARAIYDSQPTVNRGLTAVLDAYEAAQREPEAIPFDFEKWKTGEWDLILNGMPTGTGNTVYLDSIPDYTMRKKS